jgi:flavorubredoxin
VVTSLRDNIDWVGHVDWTVRDFHGYRTDRGSTYNAYLLRDEKTALIDTVKAPYAEDLLGRVARRVDPAKLDFIVCNHAEPDHSGALPAVVAACPRAEVVCNEKCRDALGLHYHTAGWRFRVVGDGEELSLGRRTLKFLLTPMVHWPESMATYVATERLLFSMDGFGQHFASSGRFDDEEPLDVVLAEAKSYYANILMLYGGPIGRALEKLSGLAIEMIAPSHGVIWRTHPQRILAAYRDWVALKPAAKVLVLYDSMWGSTAGMAGAICEGAAEAGAEVKLVHVRSSDLTVIATEVLDAAAVAFGSPTLNNTMMPQVAAVLTYLKGLRPAGKAAMVFGSYGWAKGAAKDMREHLNAMKMEAVREPLLAQFAPSQQALDECRSAGELLAAKAKALAGRA